MASRRAKPTPPGAKSGKVATAAGPLHYLPPRRATTACGRLVALGARATAHADQVDCRDCGNTREWQDAEAMAEANAERRMNRD